MLSTRRSTDSSDALGSTQVNNGYWFLEAEDSKSTVRLEMLLWDSVGPQTVGRVQPGQIWAVLI